MLMWKDKEEDDSDGANKAYRSEDVYDRVELQGNSLIIMQKKKWYLEFVIAKDRRKWICTYLSFLLALFIPKIGWNPLFILWTINTICSYREERRSKFRFFYVGVAAILIVLICVNLVTGLK